MAIAVPTFGEPRQALSVPDVCVDSGADFEIRPARISDVHGMSALINQYAAANVMLARGPLYLYQHIQDYMVVSAPSKEDGHDTVIACGALHVLWSDLAEIRSIAVHEGCKKRGLGASIVAALVERCRFLGLPRVFVFTLAPGFFRSCGFEEFAREELPPVVWVECSKCPKFYRCDEIGMMMRL